MYRAFIGVTGKLKIHQLGSNAELDQHFFHPLRGKIQLGMNQTQSVQSWIKPGPLCKSARWGDVSKNERKRLHEGGIRSFLLTHTMKNLV